MSNHSFINENKYRYVLEDEASESLLTTNVDEIIPLGNISDIPNKKEQPKASLFIINDRSLPNSQPFFSVVYHGDSSGEQIQHDMMLIVQTAQGYRDAIITKHGIDIKKLVIAGDYNVSTLKKDAEQNDQIIIDEQALRDVISPIIANNHSVTNYKPSQGLIWKRRGGADRKPYNLYTQCQPKKEKKSVDNDSKEYIIEVELDGTPKEIGHDKNIEISSTIRHLITKAKDYTYTDKNYLTDDTHFQDHAPSYPLEIHNVTINASGNVPSAGVKGVKNAGDIYNRNLLNENGHLIDLESMLQMQEASTVKLFQEIDLLFPNLDEKKEIETTDGLTSALKQHNLVAQKKTEEDLINNLTTVLNNWERSDEYNQVLDQTTVDHQKLVNQGMYKIKTNLPETIKAFIKAPNTDLFGDLIKKCAQAQKQELFNGYPNLNGQQPSQQEVVNRNIENIIEQSQAHNGGPVFNVSTESTQKNQHPDFITGVHRKTVKLNFDDWMRKLDNCCEPGIIHPLTNLLNPELRKTQTQVKSVKEKLKTYANILIHSGVKKTNDSSTLQTVINDIKSVQRDCRYNRELFSLLNVIILELQHHQYCRNQPLVIKNEAQVVSEQIINEKTNTIIRERLLTHERLYSGEIAKLAQALKDEQRTDIHNVYARIQHFAGHADVFNRNSADRFYYEKTVLGLLDAFKPIAEADSNITQEELDALKENFEQVAHTQNPWMNKHRTHYGWYADVVAAVLTLGLSSFTHWAYKSCVPSTKYSGSFGWFHQATTREQNRDAIVNTVNMLTV